MKKVLMISGVLMMLAFSICLAESGGSSSNNNRSIITQVESVALKGNLLGDSTSQELWVYLPPSYFETDKRYPVVYFLHGYGGSHYQITNFKKDFNQQFGKGTIQEFIVIGVNGRNQLNGSFFVNSSVIGNWEDYVVNDVVRFVDANYRTLAQSSSRGIAGFSMGGFGALNLAMRHPDLFSVVYSLSPGLFDEKGLENAMNNWDNSFLQAYGAAFSPKPDAEFPHCNIPVFDKSPADSLIVQDWENGYGNLKRKISDYLLKKDKLTAMRIEYGVEDSYPWIPQGCVYFSKLLTEHNISHELVTFEGGHQLSSNQVVDGIIPFFSKYFR